ncbi:MAG: DUF4340 domain-containing protein [Deltaproteobacteria bacterium]|nr:DUF4340 domain-containing protein [Deltaproteobacteria bacterium]
MKKEYFLLVIVIVALGALLFYQKKGRTNYQLPKLAQLDKAVDRLFIEKAGEQVELNLRDGKWVLGKQAYPANQARVEKMIDEVRNLNLTALISDKGNYQIYELTPEKALAVRLYNGAQLLREIEVGKNSSSLRQTYVRLHNDANVYQALGNLQSNFFTTVNELRDKKVLAISPEKLAGIDEIVLEQPAAGGLQRVKLVKVKALPAADAEKTESSSAPTASWQREDGGPLDPALVTRLLKTLSDLQCESFIEDSQAQSFTNPLYRVEARGAGEAFSLVLLAAEDNKYPALSSQVQEPFWLPAWRVDSVVKSFSVGAGSENKAERQ